MFSTVLSGLLRPRPMRVISAHDRCFGAARLPRISFPSRSGLFPVVSGFPKCRAGPGSAGTSSPEPCEAFPGRLDVGFWWHQDSATSAGRPQPGFLPSGESPSGDRITQWASRRRRARSVAEEVKGLVSDLGPYPRSTLRPAVRVPVPVAVEHPSTVPGRPGGASRDAAPRERAGRAVGAQRSMRPTTAPRWMITPTATSHDRRTMTTPMGPNFSSFATIVAEK